MKKYLARVLALLLTVLPWVSVLTLPRLPKAESALVGPLQPELHSVSQAQPSTSAAPGTGFLAFWTEEQNLRASLSKVVPNFEGFTENARAWFKRQARLQLDGG